jgi:hypothetical protein
VDRLTPAITLMLIAPVFTELLTATVPVHVMVRLVLFLSLGTIGYGFPVLLLRECRSEKGGGSAHILLGLVYGIYNEGWIAKSFLQTHGLPIPNFDGYGFFGGMELGGGMSMSAWHAFTCFCFQSSSCTRSIPIEDRSRD